MMFDSLRKRFFPEKKEVPDASVLDHYNTRLKELEDEQRMQEYDRAMRQAMLHGQYSQSMGQQMSATAYNQLMNSYPNQMNSLGAVDPRSIYSNQLYSSTTTGGLGAVATPESKVKDKVKKVLDDLEVYYTMPVTSGYGNSGVPDILACIEGHFFGIECKARSKTPTALQMKHLNDIEAAGGASLVIDETNVGNTAALILAKLGALK